MYRNIQGQGISIKVKFEDKIFTGFVLALFLGFSAINIVSLFFYKISWRDTFYLHIESELALKQINPSHPLPPYIKVFPHSIFSPEWEPFPRKLGGNFVYISTSPIYQRVKELATCLFLWEAALILSLSFIFYKLLWLHLREREENKQFLEMLLLAISHKLGNFLAAQRVNIEIIKTMQSPKAVKRLEMGYDLVEKELEHILWIIKNFNGRLRQKQKFDLAPLISEIISEFKEELKGKSMKVSLFSAQIYGVKTEIKMILYNLIENAVKYANKEISIQLASGNGKTLFIVKNDIKPHTSRGSGIGLNLAEKLARANRVKLAFGEKNGCFLVKVEFESG